MKRYMISTVVVLLLVIMSVYGGQSRISVDSAGWRNEIEALKTRMDIVEQKNIDLEAQNDILEAEIAILKDGQIFLTQWNLTQLSSQILEAGQFPTGRGVWVCDLDTPTGERLEDRDVYIDGATITKLGMETQIAKLQP